MEQPEQISTWNWHLDFDCGFDDTQFLWCHLDSSWYTQKVTRWIYFFVKCHEILNWEEFGWFIWFDFSVIFIEGRLCIILSTFKPVPVLLLWCLWFICDATWHWMIVPLLDCILTLLTAWSISGTNISVRWLYIWGTEPFRGQTGRQVAIIRLRFSLDVTENQSNCGNKVRPSWG